MNLLAWKRARAQHKRLVKLSKDQSWREHMEKVNAGTPKSKVYDVVRSIKGRRQRKIKILHHNGETYSTIPEIAETLARNFSKI